MTVLLFTFRRIFWPHTGIRATDLSLCFQKAFEEKSHVLRVHSFGNSRLGAVTKDLDASLSDSDFAHELHHKLLFLEFLIQLNRAAGHNKIEFIETSASSEKYCPF